MALELIEESRVEVADARDHARRGAEPEIRAIERARSAREGDAANVALAHIEIERTHLGLEHILEPGRADREQLEALRARRRLRRRATWRAARHTRS